MTANQAYRKILVAVDGSAASKKGLREAVRLARTEGAKLVILHVVDEFYAFAGYEGMGAMQDLLPHFREGGERILERAKGEAQKGRVPVQTVLREMLGGKAANPIVQEARKQGADLIVLGTHGRRGMSRLVLGSDAEQVVRTSRVPVLLVRA